MDTTVTQLGAVIIAALRAANFMESTIGNYQKSINALTRFVAAHGGVYTPALGARFAALTTSPRTGRFSVQRRFDYTRLVRVIDSYLECGVVILSVRKRGGGGPQPASAEFLELNSS